MKKQKRIVIAIGGNAITRSHERGTVEEQLRNIKECCEIIADLADRGYQVILTHGNGPQVGNIVLQNDIAKHQVPESPLDICDAETQGSLGYLLTRGLRNALKKHGNPTEIATILTEIRVDPADPAFLEPTKFIGPFFSKEEAEAITKEKGYLMKEDSGRGYRRVVPSPAPIELMESTAISALLDKGFILITGGGGGIPVIRKNDELQGIEAVIDKDFTSALIAEQVAADLLIIITGVAQAAIHFGKPDMQLLDRITVSECRRYLDEGEFPPGSMGPKMQAAIQFASSGGSTVITSLSHLESALEENDGTWIIPD